ncbi:HigA family addiction module antitoxin [Novispirillum sp. DQ9]|uniref:HigA family addiction module antitoxin n=1 Tax=Novispirillum sp. DQ9 TaxID=3398612 RepID=UPI003C7A5FB4
MTSKSSITIDALALPPIHPGEILAEELAEAGVSVAALARALDVPQSRMAEVVAGKRAVTADTALRLGLYFGTTARFWMNLQAAYDLAVAEATDGARLAAVVRPHAA